MNQTIKSMSNHFTPKELILIAESLENYNRCASSKQISYTINKLRQIFTEANRIKAAN